MLQYMKLAKIIRTVTFKIQSKRNGYRRVVWPVLIPLLRNERPSVSDVVIANMRCMTEGNQTFIVFAGAQCKHPVSIIE